MSAVERPDAPSPPATAAATGVGAEETAGRTSLVPFLMLMVPPLCWAGNFVVGRAVHAGIPPEALTFWRWAVAFVLLLPFAGNQAWRARDTIRRHGLLLTTLAATGVLGFQYVVYRGLQTTTAINGVLIIATIPVAIPIFSYFLDGARLSLRQALGIAISATGVAIVILRGEPANLFSLKLTPGDLWVLAAVPMWAIYSVLVRRRPASLPPLALLLVISLIGLVLIMPLYAWQYTNSGGFEVTMPALLAIAYVGAFASVLAFALWNRGVAAVGANKAGLFIHLMPIFAAILAVIFLGEDLFGHHYVGIAFIAAGLYLSSTARRR